MADNRQFTDHNSIGNVNVYYKDRQLKERTAVSNAASIANLKFLLTTGDDEGFRTAIKSYIDEAIRSALGALVDNLDKGTGVSRILGTDSSHDLGTITPANLASVLGGETTYTDLSCDADNPINLNTILKRGTYKLSTLGSGNSYTNGPDGRLWGLMKVETVGAYLSQTIYQAAGDKVYVRIKDNGALGVWKELTNSQLNAK